MSAPPKSSAALLVRNHLALLGFLALGVLALPHLNALRLGGPSRVPLHTSLWSGSWAESQHAGASLAALLGGGGGAGATGPLPARGDACDLDLDGPIPDSCTMLSDVCVDQQAAVLHGKEYALAPDGRAAAAPLPVLVPEKRWRHFIYTHKATGAKDYHYGLPQLHARAASTAEPTPYLADPVFSSCTVPILYYAHYIGNPSHMFRDNAARLYGALAESSWRDHAKVVLMTAEGLAAPGFARDVMQPLSGLAVETWAEFSSRLPSMPVPGGGHVPVAAAPQPPGAPQASFEGGPRRCFRRMAVCMNNLNITNWPLHEYGQQLARYYRHRLPLEALAQPPEALPRRLARAAAASGGGSGGGGSSRAGVGASSEAQQEQAPPQDAQQQQARQQQRQAQLEQQARQQQAQQVQQQPPPGEPAVLRVAFQKRSGDRLLLNAAELLDKCNAWRYTTAAGVQVRAHCWEVEIPDLIAGIGAAQAADVFVGSHGANMANGWYMRPGSSIIELTMYGFDELAPGVPRGPHIQYPRRNMFDEDTQVQWWKLLTCDPREGRSWTAGAVEAAARAAGAPPDHNLWPKYRNLIVRWEGLDAALRAIVDTGGDMEAYRRRWQDGTWWWLTTESEVVPAGPSWYGTCRRAHEAGMIH